MEGRSSKSPLSDLDNYLLCDLSMFFPLSGLFGLNGLYLFARGFKLEVVQPLAEW